VLAAVPELAGMEIGPQGRRDRTVRRATDRLSEPARAALAAALEALNRARGAGSSSAGQPK
jgi:hypothetical protein